MKKKIARETQIQKVKNFLLTHKKWLIVLAIFGLEIFLRFFQIAERSPFGWDQVDNAWAAKNILINHWYPLVGMAAKGNSGFNIGPLYYYVIAIVYWFTKLSPIASGIFAGITSIFSFWVLFYVTRKLFSFQTAVIAVFMNTAATGAIIFDRVQWPVNFIPALSLLILYFLYKTITEDVKNFIWVGLLVGCMLNIHFTVVFFPIIIALSLPFFPRRWQTLFYGAIGVLISILFFVPNIIFELQSKHTESSHLSGYVSTYYHGFHLRRVFQIVGDGFIQYEPLLLFPAIKLLKYILTPLFFIVYLYKHVERKRIVLCYLIALFFIVPWFVFATYSGEISDYYFAINRFVALLIIAYFISMFYSLRSWIPKIIVIAALGVYGYIGISTYFSSLDTSVGMRMQEVKKTVDVGGVVQFTQGVPESYIYYFLMHQKGVEVYGR